MDLEMMIRVADVNAKAELTRFVYISQNSKILKLGLIKGKISIQVLEIKHKTKSSGRFFNEKRATNVALFLNRRRNFLDRTR